MVRRWQKTQLGQYLTQALPVEEDDISPERLKRALNRVQIGLLPFISGSVAILFLLYAGVQALFLQEFGMPLYVAVALISATLLLPLQWLSQRISLPEQWVNPLFAFIAGLVLLSMLLRQFLTAELKQTANLILFLVAISVFFTTARWLYGLIGVTLLGWALSAFWPLAGQRAADWGFYAVVMLAAAITAVILHQARIAALTRITMLQFKERQQRRALQRRTMQLQTSADIGQQITSILDLERLLRQVAELIQQRYNLHYVGVFLLTPPRKIVIAAEAGERLPEHGSNLQISHHGLIGRALASGQPQRVSDLQNDPDYLPHESLAGARSELILPLKTGKQQLGVLDLQSSLRNAFAAAEVPIFQLLADQVTAALENARLYNEVKQFNQQLEQKVAERTEALQQANARLERLDKTKTDFITISSHELRTPLTILTFYSQMFLDDETIQADESYLKWANGIHQGAMRMEEVVERMLDVAKIDSMSLRLFPAPVKLPFLLSSIRHRFRQDLAARNLTLTIGDLSPLPEIEADAEALQKVFYHLLINAIKYTPDGGDITVNGRFHPAVDSQPDSVEITIADTGIGINPDVQELIFEKFYQTGDVQLHSSGKSSFKGGGAGLGLAIARGIVTAHNGRIWAESPGYDETNCPGSRFHVRLPVKQPV